MENPNVKSRAIMSQAKAIKDFNFLTDSIVISNYLGGYYAKVKRKTM